MPQSRAGPLFHDAKLDGDGQRMERPGHEANPTRGAMMTTNPVSVKLVDPNNVQETLAMGMTVVHPYAPGLMQIIFTAPRHDPQAVAERRFNEAVSFAVVARIVFPTAEIAGLTELLNRQAAAVLGAEARISPEGHA
jgi:hypothetical protein